MSEVDLRKSMICTLRNLLESKKNIELQIEEAKGVIVRALKTEDGLKPISIESDTLWFNYLSKIYTQVEHDIALAKSALVQLGVSKLSLESFENLAKNQGDSALDFSVSKE